MRVIFLALAFPLFVLAFIVTRQRATSPDGGLAVGLLAASPFLVVGVLLVVSALLADRRR